MSFYTVVAPTTRSRFLQITMACDLMVDCLHWSGGNTTLDALHCGLPVLTCPGRFMRGRQSAAMLRLLGLADELVVTAPADMAERAVALGGDPALRQQLSARIQAGVPGLIGGDAALARMVEHVRQALV